mmetsp:Transcript_19455/g.46984  ORF Transcript_19455/g.46984 Transcript_19455/m.46984 type:complete len:226 (-) Transcript_19455:3487-4164(-)
MPLLQRPPKWRQWLLLLRQWRRLMQIQKKKQQMQMPMMGKTRRHRIVQITRIKPDSRHTVTYVVEDNRNNLMASLVVKASLTSTMVRKKVKEKRMTRQPSPVLLLLSLSIVHPPLLPTTVEQRTSQSCPIMFHRMSSVSVRIPALILLLIKRVVNSIRRRTERRTRLLEEERTIVIFHVRIWLCRLQSMKFLSMKKRRSGKRQRLQCYPKSFQQKRSIKKKSIDA